MNNKPQTSNLPELPERKNLKELPIRFDIRYPGGFTDHIELLSIQDEPDRAIIVRRQNRKRRQLFSMTRAGFLNLFTRTINEDKRIELQIPGHREGNATP
ncbi:MAG: hypothetical protein ACOYM3_30555 [Terrimicrobiaceae bacterium]